MVHLNVLDVAAIASLSTGWANEGVKQPAEVMVAVPAYLYNSVLLVSSGDVLACAVGGFSRAPVSLRLWHRQGALWQFGCDNAKDKGEEDLRKSMGESSEKSRRERGRYGNEMCVEFIWARSWSTSPGYTNLQEVSVISTRSSSSINGTGQIKPSTILRAQRAQLVIPCPSERRCRHWDGRMLFLGQLLPQVRTLGLLLFPPRPELVAIPSDHAKVMQQPYTPQHCIKTWLQDLRVCSTFLLLSKRHRGIAGVP